MADADTERWSRARGRRAVAALAAFLATSCATREVAPLPAPEATAYRWSHVDGGLRASAEPIAESERAQQYFGFDARASRVLPILIAFENEGATSSFRVGPDLIAVDGDAGREPIRVGGSSGETAQAVSLLLMFVPFVGPVAALASLPAGASAARQRSDATVALHQIAATQLREHTVSPGETERAVVFLAFDPDAPVPPAVTLTLGAADLGGGPERRFAFPISLADVFE